MMPSDRQSDKGLPCQIEMGFTPSLVISPSKRGNKKAMLFLNRGPGETEFKTVGNPLWSNSSPAIMRHRLSFLNRGDWINSNFIVISWPFQGNVPLEFRKSAIRSCVCIYTPFLVEHMFSFNSIYKYKYAHVKCNKQTTCYQVSRLLWGVFIDSDSTDSKNFECSCLNFLGVSWEEIQPGRLKSPEDKSYSQTHTVLADSLEVS